MERIFARSPESHNRRVTRPVRVGSVTIGGDAPVVIQSMTATRTQDVEATVAQVLSLEKAGAGIVRIAVDSQKDAEALAQIRKQTNANLSVDLQENYRLATTVAPYVDKIRYNPGHLYHHERTKSVQDKVTFIADTAAKNDCAIRIGVNCGSVDPELASKFGDNTISAMVESALMHCDILDRLGFTRYVVSLKDSDPQKVIKANQHFARLRPDVPLHLGVTEAGLPPAGIVKTRIALVRLLAKGIGETLRVSLTVPNHRKGEEVTAGYQIIEEATQGSYSLPVWDRNNLNIISCPSCSRVENEAFVELAQKVKETTEYAKDHAITIAVMGCRVNGPGETDKADLGLWCGPKYVNLKLGTKLLGAYTYDEILPRLRNELDKLIAKRKTVSEF